jgi:hypothetical protein
VTLYIVGDLDRPNEEVIRLIEASFGGFPAGVLVTCISNMVLHVKCFVRFADVCFTLGATWTGPMRRSYG